MGVGFLLRCVEVAVEQIVAQESKCTRGADDAENSIKRFIKTMAGQNRAHDTLLAYGSSLRKFLRFLPEGFLLGDTTERHIRSFFAQCIEGEPDKGIERIDPKSVNNYLATLRTFFNFLKYEDRIKINPAQGVSFLRCGKKIPRYLSQEQVSQLLQQAKKESLVDYALIYTLYYAALRAGEICGIKREGVNLFEHYVHVHGKGNRDRNVPFLSDGMKPLKDFAIAMHHKFDFDRFFCTRQCKSVTGRYIGQRVKKVARRAGFYCHPHMLRHSRATHLLQAGLDLYYIKTFLGHGSIRMTEMYVHVDDQNLRAALNRAYQNPHVLL